MRDEVIKILTNSYIECLMCNQAMKLNEKDLNTFANNVLKELEEYLEPIEYKIEKVR